MHDLCSGVLRLHLALLRALLHFLQLLPQVVFLHGLVGQLTLDHLHFVVMALLHRRHLLTHLHFKCFKLLPHGFRHALLFARALLCFALALGPPCFSLALSLFIPSNAVSCLLRCYPLGHQLLY